MGLGVHLRKITIANGAAVSNYEDIQGLKLQGVILGSGWTAAALYFSGSFDGTNLFDIAGESGAVYSIAVPAVNTLYWIRRSYFEGLTSVAVKSGTPAVPVNQGAERTLYLVLAPGGD